MFFQVLQSFVEKLVSEKKLFFENFVALWKKMAELCEADLISFARKLVQPDRRFRSHVGTLKGYLKTKAVCCPTFVVSLDNVKLA